jgi:gluconolactonase
MTRTWPAALSLVCASVLALAAQQAPPSAPVSSAPAYPEPRPGPYTLGPDSRVQPNVPKGTIVQEVLPPGRVYPGVAHSYRAWLAAGADTSKPLPVMVFADGVAIFCAQAINAPVVFDNLVAKKDIPPMVAIFVDPGIMPALDPDHAQHRYNRTFEYDTIDGRFTRFVTEELMPAAARQLKVTLSADPNDRAIGGVSTGAVAAFMAAWERPDQFRRVLSYIGTFVDMKGANTLPFLIRKTEPRPIRVFMQDGTNDQNSGWGSWFQQSQEMDWALSFMNYDHTFVVGTDGHSTAQGGAIFPEALRWLWRDYPKPIVVPAPTPVAGRAQAAGTPAAAAPARPTVRPAAFNVVSPEQGWQPVGDVYPSATSLAGDKAGNMFFAVPAANRIYRIDAEGHVSIFKDKIGGVAGLAVGPDSRVYVAQPSMRRIVSYGQGGGDELLVAHDVDASAVVVTRDGAVYFTDTRARTIGAVPFGRPARVVYSGGEIGLPSALALSPDHSMLEVMDARSKFGWSFQIAQDGALTSGQPFWRLEFSEQVDMGGIAGVAMDTLGYLYLPTTLGIEMSNQIGRVELILNKPEPASVITCVAFGGAARDWLYVTTASGRIYRRPVQRTGAASWEPVKPPTPTL